MFLIVSRCLTTGAGGWDGPGGGGGGSSQVWQTPAKADGARAAPVVSSAEAVNRPSSAARRRPDVDRADMVALSGWRSPGRNTGRVVSLRRHAVRVRVPNPAQGAQKSTYEVISVPLAGA